MILVLVGHVPKEGGPDILVDDGLHIGDVWLLVASTLQAAYRPLLAVASSIPTILH